MSTSSSNSKRWDRTMVDDKNIEQREKKRRLDALLAIEESVKREERQRAAKLCAEASLKIARNLAGFPGTELLIRNVQSQIEKLARRIQLEE